MPLNTLFDERIRNPRPVPTPRRNTCTLSLRRQTASSPERRGSRAPCRQSRWLTPPSQDSSPHPARGAERQPEPRPTHPTPIPRRQGCFKLALMGMPKCGKSSVQKVVFEKVAPADTLYFEVTRKIESASMQSFIHFESVEVPSHLSWPSPESDHATVFSSVGAVVWIIDSQDEYISSIDELLRTVVFLAVHYPHIHIHVFIHKTDGLSDEYRYDTFREVRQRVQDELSDCGHADRVVGYYQTSIFEPSVFDAVSKVVQTLLPQLSALESLLNRLCSSSRIQKAFLFDTPTRLYLAADTSAAFLRDYELCADHVDVLVDIKQLYTWRDGARAGAGAATPIAESTVTSDATGDTYLYAREINESLSLLCVMGKGCSVRQRALIDYNVEIMHEALVDIFRL